MHAQIPTRNIYNVAIPCIGVNNMALKLLRENTRPTRIMSRILLIAVLFTIMTPLMNLPTVSATTNSSSDHLFEVTIVDANYLDADSDYYADDVVALLRFDLGYAAIYDFYYLITLTLPSGLEYSYLVHVIAWADTIYIYNVFYDHATESGDYTIYVSALMISPTTIADSATYIFDPPGGSPGGRPTFAVY